MNDETFHDRNIAMDAVRVTEAAAIAASRFMGRGDSTAADQAAINAMHESLKKLSIDGTVRIGEGLEGIAPKLYIGEKVGNGRGPAVDVALLPLEGATTVARGEPNALSIIAMAERGVFLKTPRIYMDKIAVGGGLPEGIIDLDRHPAENLRHVAEARGVSVGELVVCILDRPRHGDLIAKVRESGARILLISDGDVSGVIATTWSKTGVDMYLGVGGAPQGVLAAAALACVGGQMEGRLVFRNDEDQRLAREAGIEDLNRKYTVDDMASGEVTVAVTGVTGGAMLDGVRRERGGVVVSHSLILRSKTSTIRYLEAHHHGQRKRPAQAHAPVS